MGGISALVKRVLPFLVNYVLPVASQFVGGLVHDITIGKGIKNSLKSQAKKTVKRVYCRAARGKGAGGLAGADAVLVEDAIYSTG